MATKYYRALKDGPAMFKGAILKDYDSISYRPISDLWDRIENVSSEVKFAARVVENSPEFYERVYELPGQSGGFATQEVARAEAEKLFYSGEKQVK